jgi:hypothetical protein
LLGKWGSTKILAVEDFEIRRAQYLALKGVFIACTLERSMHVSFKYII